MVMNINESHQLGVSCDTEDAEGSRGVSGGPAQGGDVGATLEKQCPVEDGLSGQEGEQCGKKGFRVGGVHVVPGVDRQM